MSQGIKQTYLLLLEKHRIRMFFFSEPINYKTFVDAEGWEK